MLLNFKTLQQKTFTIEAEPSETVLQLKTKVSESQQFPVEAQKIIFSGKILVDDKPLSEYNIGEKDFLVVMVTKAVTKTTAPTPAPTTSSSSSTTTTTTASAAATPSTTPSTTTPATTTTTAPAAAPAPAPAASADPSFAMGAAYQSAVKNLEEMGFEKDQIKAAMKAAFNNPDRAVEYLMNGIPENVAREIAAASSSAAAGAVGAPTPAAATTASPATGAPAAHAASPPVAGAPVNLFEAARVAAAGGGAAAAATAPGSAADLMQLAQLTASPQFQQLRQVIQTQPQLLPVLLQQIGQSNPHIFQLITRNQDAFLQMLMEGSGGEGVGDMEGLEGMLGGDGAVGQTVVHISPEEEAAINRLIALGFERNMVIEAFFACDKNEEMAANYLFDQGDF